MTGDVLTKLLQVCAGERSVDLRDRALLLTAFASGGRRRSEVAALRVEDLVDEEPVRADPTDAASPPLPCLSIRLGRTKTTTSIDDERVVLIGRPVVAVRGWLEHAGISEGPVFRRIDQWGSIDRRALTPQSVNLILKGRCKQPGLEPALFSAPRLRSGYLTEAANRGMPEAMQQSRHESVAQAASYYNNAYRKNGRAARLII
ncbi:phage integrase family protein [Ensifer adhaerens]|nr:phage integrase family protein [Ensifer adhaerens]